ncbi:MAG: hypothetical protein MJ210_01525 [Alphaproteobacteria bacterium]|nr:hypothetical protein [Alphaproteobacteria bacterium]
MKKILLMATALSLMATTTEAKLFSVHVVQGSLNETRGFDSVVDIFDHYEDGLKSIFSTYSTTTASATTLDFRGIKMNLNFDSSHRLNFLVPSLGISETFNGGSQQASFNLFKDYLKSNKDGLLKRILKSSVADTPYDMVAGNPNSLMATMADDTFQRGGGGILGNFVSYLSPDASTHYFKFNGDNKKATVYSLPMGKIFKFGNGSALMLDLPISYTDLDGSRSYQVQLGLGYMIPVVKSDKIQWHLTPSVRAGAVGSEDMLSGGILYTGSLTSNVKIPIGEVTFGMTNMVGYIKDFSIKVADYEVEYDLKNMVYKNGVSLNYALNDKWNVGGSYNYTFYTGSDLFIKDYHDVNFALSRKFRERSYFSGIAFVGNYSSNDKDYHAYRIGVNFLF